MHLCFNISTSERLINLRYVYFSGARARRRHGKHRSWKATSKTPSDAFRQVLRYSFFENEFVVGIPLRTPPVHILTSNNGIMIIYYNAR